MMTTPIPLWVVLLFVIGSCLTGMWLARRIDQRAIAATAEYQARLTRNEFIKRRGYLAHTARLLGLQVRFTEQVTNEMNAETLADGMELRWKDSDPWVPYITFASRLNQHD